MASNAERLKVGSLFSGIGGFDLGLERAGMSTSWFVENNAYCQAVLRKNWPNVPIYDDIRDVDVCQLSPIDVLCGGFPCQDLSVAGTGAGLTGARSGLWSEFVRIIGGLRPRYVIVENVSVLRSRGLGRILGEMAALGYDAEWDCIPASAVGAPHRRDRVWIVAYPGGVDGGSGWTRGSAASGARESVTEWSLQIPDAHRAGLQGRSLPSGECSENTEFGDSSPLADSDEFGRLGRSGEQRSQWGSESTDSSQRIAPDSNSQPTLRTAKPWGECGYWSVEPDVGRVADGVPARVDRLRALGNALIPQIAEHLGSRILEYERK
jgi:DNA (cytosine-5)-methyltransferase 1